jgi:precorrin-2/cobalt-factor-2 C20-methyltransferase
MHWRGRGYEDSRWLAELRRRESSLRLLRGGTRVAVGRSALVSNRGAPLQPDAGVLIGVGVGPGDPELMTLKAVRALESADVVAHFAKAGNASNARATAARYLRPGTREVQLLYPVTTEHATSETAYRTAIDRFFDESAAQIAQDLAAGKTVAVLSEGDPLFFGSYMHIHIRLMSRFRTEVIPGVTAMSGCWSAAGLPIVQGDDVLTVLPGTLTPEALVQRLQQNEPAVIMKLGRNLPKVRRALIESGRLEHAIYIERGTMSNERLMPLAEKTDDSAPYFAIVLVTNRWWQT